MVSWNLSMFQMTSADHIRTFLQRELELLRLSVSFIFIVAIYLLMAFVTLMFAGQIDQAHLTGVGLAITLYNIIICSVSIGYSSMFDTYGPQVHESDKLKRGELGTVLQKCLLQGLLSYLIILGPFFNIVYIIDRLPESGIYSESSDQDISETGQEDFRDIAVEYLRIIFMVQYLDYALMIISKYFAIQGYTKFVYLVSLVMIGSQILFNYVLVNVHQMDVKGLGFAALLGRLTPLVVSLSVCFVMVWKGQFAWNGFSNRVFLGWKPMIKLGLSGVIHYFAEQALFEVGIFLSQFDGATTLAVVIIVMQLYVLAWSIALGMSQASAALIGAALVEGHIDETKYYMKLSIMNSTVLSITIAVIAYCLRSHAVLIFSDDNDIKEQFQESFWIVSILYPIDNMQTTLNEGILVAFGAQSYTARSMSVSTFFIGIPIIFITIFLSDLKMIGIFIGFIAMVSIMVVTASAKIWKVDIGKEIEKARQRVSSNNDKLSDCIDEVENFETAEIHENPECSTNHDGNALEKTIQLETLEFKVEDVCEEEINKKENGSEPNPGIGSTTDGGKKEMKYVFLMFASAAVFCATLAGVSFIGK